MKVEVFFIILSCLFNRSASYLSRIAACRPKRCVESSKARLANPSSASDIKNLTLGSTRDDVEVTRATKVARGCLLLLSLVVIITIMSKYKPYGKSSKGSGRGAGNQFDKLLKACSNSKGALGRFGSTQFSSTRTCLDSTGGWSCSVLYTKGFV
jgi:hypothetical protein